MLVVSLLVSPLGWSYYVPLAAGPLLATVRHSSVWSRVAIALGYVCVLAVPPPAGGPFWRREHGPPRLCVSRALILLFAALAH